MFFFNFHLISKTRRIDFLNGKIAIFTRGVAAGITLDIKKYATRHCFFSLQNLFSMFLFISKQNKCLDCFSCDIKNKINNIRKFVHVIHVSILQICKIYRFYASYVMNEVKFLWNLQHMARMINWDWHQYYFRRIGMVIIYFITP